MHIADIRLLQSHSIVMSFKSKALTDNTGAEPINRVSGIALRFKDLAC